jgi:hypothetical protein
MAERTAQTHTRKVRPRKVAVSKLAGFLLRLTDELFAEEAAGDFRTKSRPELPGMPGIQPAASVAMGRDVRVGT